MDIRVQVGLRLKNLRTEKGISQETLALNSGVDRAYLGRIERGEVSVGVQVLKRLLKSLDSSFSELFNGL
ncbi:MAG TPA: helix-turn-helix transcriptional regulator [Saccharofermentans sp.]|nr:helix-turn-helix transcriptional regulator [Saccharofermentans sp.]